MCRAPVLSLLLMFATAPAVAVQPQAITINSRLAAHVRPLSAPAEAPPAYASVLLIAGSNGALGLSPTGDVLEQQQNFVIRSAYRFLTSGLNVAMLDSDPLFPHPNGYTNQRHTQQHADLLANAVRLVRTEWPTVPIWVISTANGTISAVNLAARYANSQLPLKGLILTSSVTAPNPSPGGEHHEVISLNPGLNSIKVPTLVVWHKGDDCPTSPSTNASTVFTALTNVASPDKAAVVIDKGGWLAMPPCSSLAYHGYNGAEDQVVLAIAKFIAAHP